MISSKDLVKNFLRKAVSLCQRRWLVLVLLFAGLSRLLTLGAYPLFDNTESRYAEIARKMAETHNWITPQYDYGVPFWGKPPLSTWATAASFEVLGVGEFAARISSFLFALLIVWLVYRLASWRGGEGRAPAAAMVTATTVLFFVSGGSVMTDPALALGTTLSMVSFWLAVKGGERGRLWGYLFFAGLGIGLLAKGPVALVLTLLPVGAWTAWKKQWPEVLRGMPWAGGTALMLLIALPWYLAAERATPGFLDYFIVGEHWKRFTQSGWRGDLYGTAHSRPHGVIWLYWLGATFPWCLVFIGALTRGAGRAKALVFDEWSSFLLLWAVTPMLFFSMAGNILWTYVLPGIPAFSLLVADVLCGETHPSGRLKSRWLLASAGLATPVVFTLLVLVPPVEMAKVSQRDIVYGYLKARPSQASQLVYLSKRPYSAEFYSDGRALEARGALGAEHFLHGGPNFFVVKKDALISLPGWFKDRLVKVNDYGKYELLGEKPSMRSMAPRTCHPLS
jgi:4-amino-4-deoxy-L-arabinose transferase-like glycosyltransferase